MLLILNTASPPACGRESGVASEDEESFLETQGFLQLLQDWVEMDPTVLAELGTCCPSFLLRTAATAGHQGDPKTASCGRRGRSATVHETQTVHALQEVPLQMPQEKIGCSLHAQETLPRPVHGGPEPGEETGSSCPGRNKRTKPK